MPDRCSMQSILLKVIFLQEQDCSSLIPLTLTGLVQKKYGMTLDGFEITEMVKELNYSFEAESDYHDWDMAVDGIKTLRRDLEEIRSS